MHIAFNMLTLFFLGRPVEEKYGKQEFLRFYLLAVIFAGAVWMAFYLIFPPGVPVIGVGASGGVMAVAILFIFNFPHSTLLVFGVVPVRAWVVGVILIGVDLLNSLNPETRIGWQAHLAGAAFGAAYFYFKWNFTFIPLNKIGNLFKAQPKLKVHQPDHKDERLREQADQILDKLHRQGEASLTSRERKILERYSRSVRQNRGDQS